MIKILDTIFPMVANYLTNREIRKKLCPKDATWENLEQDSIFTNIDSSKFALETIKEQYDDTLKVKEKLEDKAKTNIIGVTISITLIMGASGVLSVLREKYPFLTLSWILFALFIISVAYMLIAGLLVIRLLTNENEVYRVKLCSLISDDKKLRDDYGRCILQNQNKNVIRNNYIFTSYECIRNALVCLFIILILIAIPFTLPTNNVDREFTYTSQTYFFMFSASAVDYINEYENRTAVEKAVVDAIERIEINDLNQSFGIIDNSTKLFIKFKVANNSITILLIEPYSLSVLLD